jgi:tetratricopeptide (TPR) repeat protein
VGDETIGDFDGAMKSYREAAEAHSSEPVVVTLDRAWRGKPVSAMAEASEKRLETRLKHMDDAEKNAILFTLRGVSASNQNNLEAARQNFLQAYQLDPGSAFSLNNRGFVAEMDGDLETAEFFYGKARKAGDANVRVGLATQHVAEGKRLFTVASDSDQQVDNQLDKYSRQRRQQTGPIELTPRGNGAAGDSGAQPAPPAVPNQSPTPIPPAPQFQ